MCSVWATSTLTAQIQPPSHHIWYSSNWNGLGHSYSHCSAPLQCSSVAPTPTAQVELSTPALHSRPEELTLGKGALSKELILCFCSMEACICIFPNLWQSKNSRNETRLCCVNSCAMPPREFCFEVIFFSLVAAFQPKTVTEKKCSRLVELWECIGIWLLPLTIYSYFNLSIEKWKTEMAFRNSTQPSREGKASSRSCGR